MDKAEGGSSMDGRACGARKRRGPGACGRPAGAGTDHLGWGRCSWHGGAAPSGRTAAARQKVDAEVLTLLNREGLSPVDDPLRQLQLVAAEALALKNLLADRVEELSSWSYDDLSGHEEIRAVLHAYERALDRCDRILTGMVKLDLDIRLVRLSEAQAGLLMQVVEAVLDSRELHLDATTRSTGRRILVRELEGITSR
jgi:hypothetical protein